MKLRYRLGVISLAFLRLRGDIRKPSKDQSKDLAKVECSVQLHELDGTNGHVRMAGAREVVISVQVPASVHKESAA